MHHETMALVRWVLTLLLLAGPFFIFRFLARRLTTRRPDRAAGVSFVLMLMAPVVSMVVVLSATKLHWSWIVSHRAPPGVATTGEDLAVIFAFVFGMSLPVLGSLLWLASRIRREHHAVSAARRRFSRMAAVVAVGVNLIAWGTAIALRAVFSLSVPTATVIAATATISTCFLFGPFLFRLLLRPSPRPADALRLARARALLAAEGLAQHRLEVCDVRGGSWANALAIGPVPGSSRIVLTRRLMDVLDADEIAAVVAHEIGHVRRWHLAKLFLCDLALVVLAATILKLIRGHLPPGDMVAHALGLVVSGIAIGAVALPATIAAIARHFEREADRFASDRGHAAFLASALEKLVAENAGSPSDRGIEQIFALHPPALDRIRSLLRHASRDTPEDMARPAKSVATVP